jgi:hypothetical protein
MKNTQTIPELKGREFNGTYYPKIRNVRQQPRKKIRQVLRAIISFDLAGQRPKGGQQIRP